MKDVTAAVIMKDGKVFIARRAPGENSAGGWEFPGGKVEKDETPQECLRRELFEELGIKAEIGEFVCESIYEYPKGTIRLLAYRAEIIDGGIGLSVHDDCRWVPMSELKSYRLLPADVPVAEKLVEIYI
ncbi:MAG TPA: (deoxy)nucleoside triphosphate pyrophosphohydrolase [Clostridia bacterium]|nr:(deoxy)nucleoside triphosphate pyrophosphohydrolase [Clostridia bacterium]